MHIQQKHHSTIYIHRDKIHIDDKFLEEIEYQLNHLILDHIFRMKHFHQIPLFDHNTFMSQYQK